MKTNSTHPPEPVPVEWTGGVWAEWGGVLYLIGAITLSAIVGWHVPARYQSRFFVGPFAVGLCFDVASLVCYGEWLRTRRHVSAFPLFGLGFYLWAWLSQPTAFVVSADRADGLATLWLRKLADLATLIDLHLLFHGPFWLLGWFDHRAARARGRLEQAGEQRR